MAGTKYASVLPVPVGASIISRWPGLANAVATSSAISACCGRGVRLPVISVPPSPKAFTTAPMSSERVGTMRSGTGTSGTTMSSATGSRCWSTKPAHGCPARPRTQRCRRRAGPGPSSSSRRLSMTWRAMRASSRASCLSRPLISNSDARSSSLRPGGGRSPSTPRTMPLPARGYTRWASSNVSSRWPSRHGEPERGGSRVEHDEVVAKPVVGDHRPVADPFKELPQARLQGAGHVRDRRTPARSVP